MPTIRISDESMQRLKAWAEPLVDTADSALAKALDAAERYRSAHDGMDADSLPQSAPRDEKSPQLPEGAVREPLMEVIYERGGSATGRDLYPALRERMKRYLTPGDFDRVKPGDERWRSTVKSARDQLVQDGYLRDDSPRGVWALSKEGLALVESHRAASSGSFVDHLLAFPEVGDDAVFERPALRPAAARPVSYLVDTNVLSELRKRSRANQSVIAWFEEREPAELYLSVLVIGELAAGRCPHPPPQPGKRRSARHVGDTNRRALRRPDTRRGSRRRRAMGRDHSTPDRAGRGRSPRRHGARPRPRRRDAERAAHRADRRPLPRSLRMTTRNLLVLGSDQR